MDGQGGDGTSVLMSGDQQIVLSAEDAAHLLAQAGIQIGDNEQVIMTQGGGHADGQQVMEAALNAAEHTTDQVGPVGILWMRWMNS